MKRLALAVAGVGAAKAQLAPVPATQYSAPIVGTVATVAVLIAGIAGQRIYVTAVDLVPVATSVVTFTQGTGATCSGGSTAGNVTGPLTFVLGRLKPSNPLYSGIREMLLELGAGEGMTGEELDRWCTEQRKIAEAEDAEWRKRLGVWAK